MPLTTRPFLASLKALTRSVLFALGVDHALIDFVARAAVGGVSALLAILTLRESSRACRLTRE
jgi:hypothetical protein